MLKRVYVRSVFILDKMVDIPNTAPFSFGGDNRLEMRIDHVPDALHMPLYVIETKYLLYVIIIILIF